MLDFIKRVYIVNKTQIGLSIMKIAMYADDTSLAPSAKDVNDNQYHEL